MIDVSMLNDEQKEAVLSDDQYIRVIAGAGSGKTRVLTTRIEHLIEDEDVRPYKILAITFTNKAANEMKQRLASMLGEETAGMAWISTIHSMCVRILRQEIDVIGYPKSFTIMDVDDQKAMLKTICRELDVDTKKHSYPSLIAYISDCKTSQISVEGAKKLARLNQDEALMARVYEAYCNRQKEIQALDFDDLILTVNRIFREFESIRDKWAQRFEFILVDEFQDIDENQYRLIRYLCGEDTSLYVVGDPDQTIYSWRGANVGIILNFERDFPTARTVILNRNYRSQSMILQAANSVIRNNTGRVKKDLFATIQSDEKVRHYSAESDTAEAAWIAQNIQKIHRSGVEYHDIAVLYRANYLSRNIETMLMESGIPYVIYGGLRFYERMEIKDTLCYIRMLTEADDLAFERVINTPKRGIGVKTLDRIRGAARENNRKMFEIVCEQCPIGGSAGEKLKAFADMVLSWRQRAETMEVEDIFHMVLKESGYQKMLKDAKEEERIENVAELVHDAVKFMADTPESTLDEYLQMVSLYTEREQVNTAEAVRLMTVHSAKGLEFDTVFVSDLSDGIFPSNRSMNDGYHYLEEERRLAYVAFTRAKHHLFLADSHERSFITGDTKRTSRFIKEIDRNCLEPVGRVKKDASTVITAETEDVHEEGARISLRTAVRAGQKVMDEVFGEGKVLSVEDGVANIAFPFPAGVKRMQATHPRLTVVEAQTEEKPAAEKKVGKIVRNDRVVHDKFGPGIVIEVKGKIATIAFTSSAYGIKKINVEAPALRRE
ncbi:MAG: UvrD-helicase domain-containing protein [Solobacterium sp.]|nr:UvrD-helicase domain-containing protein [Solobacterium sp.]